MILGKNKNLQKQYQTDCYTREEFFNFLQGDYNTRSSSSGQEETFIDFEVNGDSLDYHIYNIFYPLPLVKEILIKNWAGGWEHDQSHIHIEYFDKKWKMWKVLRLYDPKRREEEEKIITKDEIFPEIIKFIEHISKEKAKQLLRNFNLTQLL